MSKAVFVYGASRFPTDYPVSPPWEFGIPRAWYQSDQRTTWDWIIDVCTYMRMDYVILSCFFGHNTDNEMSNLMGFLNRLQERRTDGHTTLTACLVYEPWGEAWTVKRDRLNSLAAFFAHPAYARVDRKPRLYVWRCQTPQEEDAWRTAKVAYGKPLWLCPRIRDSWSVDFRSASRRLDARYQYPQPQIRDNGALPYSVSYNTGSYRPTDKTWLMRPISLTEWRVWLAEPVPAGADKLFRLDEIAEAGILAPKSEPLAYMTAVRDLA